MILLALLLGAAQEPDEMPLEVRYVDRALRFRTADGSFQGYLTGFVRIHGRTIFDRPDDAAAPLRTVPDTILLRQGRLETGGDFRSEWGYRLQFEAATDTYGQSDGDPPSAVRNAVRDVWIEWRRYPEFTIRAGQFFSPLSREDMLGTRNLEFQDRSPMNRLSTGREVGIEAYGTLGEGFATYYLMLCQAGGLLHDDGRSVHDSDDEKELIGAVILKPLANVRLGAGASVADVDDLPAADFDLISTQLSVLYLDASAGTFDGLRRRLSLSVQAHAGPASLRGEMILRRDELAEGASEDELESMGGYLLATWLLTGEDKVPYGRPAGVGPWGALELSARAARVQVRNAFESGAAARPGNAERITSFCFAVTWWYGNHVRLTIEAAREEYSDPLEFDHRREDSLTGLLARFQLDF